MRIDRRVWNRVVSLLGLTAIGVAVGGYLVAAWLAAGGDDRLLVLFSILFIGATARRR